MGSYQVSSYVSNTIGLSSFVSTVTTISLNGLIFELPIFVYFLTKIGLLTPEFMRRYRKHIVLTLILSAIITPPDVTASQILVSLPLLVLYEISIKISKRVLKNQEKK